MIFSCVTCTDTVLHQTGQRRQYVDRRVDCLSVQLTIQYDLTFGDVTGQVRNRVCNIIIRHSQDRDLCYRTFDAFYDTGTFVDCSQFTVEVSRITFTGRNLTF